MTDRGPWLWVSQDGGDQVTPDAMEALIMLDRPRLVGRTASTIVLRGDHGTEVTFHRVREADYV